MSAGPRTCKGPPCRGPGRHQPSTDACTDARTHAHTHTHTHTHTRARAHGARQQQQTMASSDYGWGSSYAAPPVNSPTYHLLEFDKRNHYRGFKWGCVVCGHTGMTKPRKSGTLRRKDKGYKAQQAGRLVHRPHPGVPGLCHEGCRAKQAELGWPMCVCTCMHAASRQRAPLLPPTSHSCSRMRARMHARARAGPRLDRKVRRD